MGNADRTQGRLFDFPTPKPSGEELKEIGISRVRAAADPEDVRRIEETIRTFARNGTPFTAWHVRQTIGHLNNPNLMGALFYAAARARVVEKVRYTTSKDDSRHSGAVAVWRGTEEFARQNFGKEETLPKDPEMLAIERINKALEKFDAKTRYRIIDYCAKRALEAENVTVATPAPPSPPKS